MGNRRRRQPQDHVAVAFAGAAQGGEPVHDARLKPDHALALFASAGSKPTEPSGSVAAVASKAAAVMAMRGFFDLRHKGRLTFTSWRRLIRC
jgi:hypothetical protein